MSFSPKPNKLLKYCQRFLNICQSGGISSNLVTLPMSHVWVATQRHILKSNEIRMIFEKSPTRNRAWNLTVLRWLWVLPKWRRFSWAIRKLNFYSIVSNFISDRTSSIRQMASIPARTNLSKPIEFRIFWERLNNFWEIFEEIHSFFNIARPYLAKWGHIRFNFSNLWILSIKPILKNMDFNSIF